MFGTKRRLFSAFVLCCILFSAGADERTIVLGGESGWSALSVSRGIGRGTGRLGREALVLDSSRGSAGSSVDMSLSFDDTAMADGAGNYEIVRSTLHPVGQNRSRHGSGAALAMGEGAALVLRGRPGSLFSTPGAAGSFRIDFWLKPEVVDNGVIVFRWRSARTGSDSSYYQSIRAGIMRNRLEWNFSNVWTDASGKGVEVFLRGRKNLIPGKWAHHELSFDAVSGLIEYRLDGTAEDIRHLTSTGTERGDVYSPILGAPADVELAVGYSGLIDEFRVVRDGPIDQDIDVRTERLVKYRTSGGRFETVPLDTGGLGSAILRVDCVATRPPRTDVTFFVRAGDNHFEWTDDSPAWIPVSSGAEIRGVTGRFFQVAGELYPDGAGSATPIVSSVTLAWRPDPPPLPPARVIAEAGDGSVTVRWNASIESDTVGYLVYFGSRSGEYLAPSSPVDVGDRLETTVSGLENGKPYYFAVAAYDAGGRAHTGPLSGETFARPLPEWRRAR